MTALREAAQQALAFTMRDFASLRDFEAARAVLHDNLRAALAEQRLTDAQQGMERSIESLKAALAQQAEPQDAELSAALGWPGGISEPVLDRKVLLQKVAALMQDKLWEDHRVSHLWGHMLAQQAEPVEPVAWVHTDAHNSKVRFLEWTQQAKGYRGDWIKTPLCNCAQPRQTDPQIEDRLARHGIPKP